jgi:hypothetical protein
MSNVPVTSLKQIDANRRNALKSTGPTTAEGKLRSRSNAIRHGLTAETVIGALEDTEDYRAFQSAVTADYDARSVVERELVLRLASLLWRLRRALAIETGLLEIQAAALIQPSDSGPETQCAAHAPFAQLKSGSRERALFPAMPASQPKIAPQCDGTPSDAGGPASGELAGCFLRLVNLPSLPLDRISRYERSLWQQALQTMRALQELDRRKPQERGRRLRRPAGFLLPRC